MILKHLVFSGGSYKVLYMLGIINHLKNNNYYDINEIKSIRATSAGSILGLILCLKLDMDIVENFAINKPWEKTLEITTDKILNALYKKGFLNVDFMRDVFANHFKHKNLKLDLTLKELNEYSNIDYYIYVFNITTFKKEIFNYKTHPNLKVIDAIYMSCSLPFVFEPMKYNENYYLDGGIEIEYPINDCVENCEDPDEILSIRITLGEKNQTEMNEDMNIINYGIYLFEKLVSKHRKTDYKSIKHEITIPSKLSNIKDAKNAIHNPEIRKKMIEDGKKYGENFLIKIKEQN